MHTMGLRHEHSRFDRDKFVSVDLQSRTPTVGREDWFSFGLTVPKLALVSAGNFLKILATDKRYTTYGTPYNYYSAMHYSLSNLKPKVRIESQFMCLFNWQSFLLRRNQWSSHWSAWATTQPITIWSKFGESSLVPFQAYLIFLQLLSLKF